MNHTEAVEQMAAEGYLLNELTPDARDAFEEHVFDCAECASTSAPAPSSFRKQRTSSRPLQLRKPDPKRQSPAPSEAFPFSCGARHLRFLPWPRCLSWLDIKTS